VPAAGRRSGPPATALLLVGLTVVALALRLPSLSDSLWGDELSTNFVVHGFGIGNPIWIIRGDQEGTPPLFFLLTWLTKGIGGVEGLRIVSLAAGLGAIPLTYVLGARTVGPAAATVGATLIALSPFQIFYATEARAYALMMFLCLLAAVLLLVALDSGRLRWWAAYGLAVAAAAYTHYTSVFVLIALLGWAFLARPEARRPLLLANVGAAVLFIPWLPGLLDDRDAPAATIIETLHPLTFARAKTDLLQLYIGHPYFDVDQLPGSPALWLIAAGVVLGIAGLVFRLAGVGRGGWWPSSAGVVLVVLLGIAAPLGAVLHNFVASSVFIPRNLIASCPGFALTLGALVTAGRAPLRVGATALLIAGFGIGAVKMLDRDNRRADYAGAASFIEASGDPGSPVVDQPEPTPGLQTDLEAALAPEGKPLPADRRIFELGIPTFTTRVDSARRQGAAIDADYPIPAPELIATQAARVAGRGTLFLVTGDVSLELARRFPGPVASFLSALPPRFHVVESRAYPGLSTSALRVYLLSGRPGPSTGSG
jgi:hypothetical protein